MTEFVYVTADAGLNLRAEPNGTILKRLEKGSKLRVVDEHLGWLQVTHGFEGGYVSKEFTTPDAPSITNSNLIAELCAQHGVAENQVRAIIAVESGGTGTRNGRVVIRFEPHIFARQLKNSGKVRQFFSWDIHESWKNHKFHGKDFHGNQDTEWEALRFAASMGGDSAYQSISMGAPQIMGFHHYALGYASAEDMLTAFADEDNQIRAMFKFFEFSGALARLKAQDYIGFATIYNGSGQAASYAKLIQDRL